MESDNQRTLFIFFDESGNLDFTPKGTDHFLLTALCTFNPSKIRDVFSKLAYELACEGSGQECFHATTDAQAVRDKVFVLIRALEEPLVLHVSIAKKRKVPPALRSTGPDFYNYMVSRALRHIAGSPHFVGVDKVVVVFSSIFTKKEDSAMVGAAKSEIKKAVTIPFWVYSHAAKAEINCQIADYCCWATYIKHERGEERSYVLIQGYLASEEHLFPDSGQDYY